jgi:hypothetical protein
MISPNLANTEVKLVKERADVEVDLLFKQNDLRVRINGNRGGSRYGQTSFHGQRDGGFHGGYGGGSSHGGGGGHR